ncbi:MAG: N-acetyltransferase [Nitrospirae bacterium]|nr:MAG: N-acetyltransferase [Nitrospirota bacterium]
MRIVFAKPREEHLRMIYEWFNRDSYVIRHEKTPISEEEFLEIIGNWTRPRGLMFVAILEHDTGEDVVGYFAFEGWDIRNRNAFCHLYLVPKWRGQGIGAMVLEEAFRIFFIEKNMNKLKALIPEPFDRIRRLIEKYGCENEGILKKELYFKGKYINIVYYGYTRAMYHKYLKEKQDGMAIDSRIGSNGSWDWDSSSWSRSAESQPEENQDNVGESPAAVEG